MARAWLAGLLSELYRESLKPVGFRKDGGTFSRNRGEYVERFNFQGSSWSSAAETLFYLNVGVEFAEFGPAESNWICFRRTHHACRVDELVPDAPEDGRCSEATDRVGLKRQLTELIDGASETIVARLPEWRRAYLARAGRQRGQADANS